MATTECGYGHIYDPNLYATCPYCNNSQPNIDFSAGATPVDSNSHTAPLSGGFAAPQSFDYGAPQGGVYVPPAPLGGDFVGGGSVGDMSKTVPLGNPAEKSVSEDEQKTTAIMEETIGFSPVVGWLVCTEGKFKGTSFNLYGKINTIGRSDRMDICIKGDPTISKENHARLAYSLKSNSFRLIPAESANDIYINEEEIYVPTTLHPYDLIEIGQTKLVFIPFCSDRFSWEKGLTAETEGA